MRNAKAGDEIVVASGTYTASAGQKNGGLFYSASDGTKEHPIIIRSEDAASPAVFSGTSTSMQYVLYITGDYWKISDITFKTAQKGMVLDNANKCEIKGCFVTDTGSEGIALRDNSSQCLVENTKVTYTGRVTPKYGEGIYIGSWYGETQYGHNCDYNIVRGCEIGPEVTAEHVIIKEMTTGNLVENCIMYGSGICGENYADSFVDLAGNDAIVRNNTMYRQQNAIIVDAIQVHFQVKDWGTGNEFYNNTCELDDASCYVAYCEEGCSLKYHDNIRIPEGNDYRGVEDLYDD